MILADDFVKQSSLVKNYQGLILDALATQDYLPFEWVELPLSPRASAFVMKDSLRVGIPGNAVRVNVTAKTAQTIADQAGLLLCSTKILDAAFEVAKKDGFLIEPRIQPPDRASRLAKGLSPSMSDAQAMLEHSRAIDALVMKKARIVFNTGKDWVVSNYLSKKPKGTAANYGWYSVGAPYRSASGYKMWQTLGFAHNVEHVDYSQTLRLLHPMMLLDGKQVSVETVAASSDWALVSSEGPVASWRIPGTGPAKPATDPQPFPEEADTMPDAAPLVSKFVEAKNFGSGGIKYVDRSAFIKHIVIHSAEMKEVVTGAEALAAWASGKDAPQASWHYGVDSDSIVQCVKDEHIAWHAPGCNKTGIGIELVGYAKQTAEEWTDAFSTAQLNLAARLVAMLCAKWKLPRVFLDAEALIAGKAGITTHAEVTKACKLAKERKLTSSAFYNSNTTHTDPGKHFPMEDFLALASSYA